MRALPILALLTGLTWLAASSDFRFDVAGGGPFAAGFPGPPGAWTVGGDPARSSVGPDAVRVDGDGTADAASLRRAFVVEPAWRGPGRALRVTGRIATERVPTRAPPERSAAFIVWFLDAAGTPFGYATVASLTGDHDRREVERVLDVPRRAERLVVALLGRSTDGAFALEAVSARSVSRTAAYAGALAALALGWTGYAIGLARWLSARLPRAATLGVGGLLAAVLVGVLMPEGISGRLVLPLYYRAVERLDAERFVPLALLYKGGHFVFFFALAAVLSACAPRLEVSRAHLLVALSLLALATEALQRHLTDRTARLEDVAIDVAAISLGIGAIAWAARRGAGGRR